MTNPNLSARQFLKLYHRTTPEAAESVYREGGFRHGKEARGEVYASNRLNGQGTGYGEGVVRMRVPRSAAELDDEFPSGERHYKIDHTQIRAEHLIAPPKRRRKS